MNKTAARKYRSRGFDNIQFEHSSIQEAHFEPESFDLVVLVNALYAFSDPFDALRRINKWLSRRGRLYLIDLGRLMNVTDWARYIIGSSVRSTGVAKTVSSFVRGRQAITQNRSIRLNQDKGRYWVHTADQFKEALEHAGFSIEEQGTCYRDACDYAICKRSPNDA
jgi:ubiquinone/menaquinone biosynthesis C-methylase UbiE